jgi:hypothetical protein
MIGLMDEAVKEKTIAIWCQMANIIISFRVQ